MRFTLSINQAKCIEWGINTTQGFVIDLINQASSWAEPVVLPKKQVYYFVARSKVADELPLIFSKEKGLKNNYDSVYRVFKQLTKVGLIEYKKFGGKDVVRLTDKGKTWNFSESHPKLGSDSENNSDEIPTYKTTIIDKDNKCEQDSHLHTSVESPLKTPEEKKEEQVAAKIEALPDEAKKIYKWFKSLIPASVTKHHTVKEEYAWIKSVADCHKIDGYSYHDIVMLIKWTRTDFTWSKNFMSLTKLRKLDANKERHIDRFKRERDYEINKSNPIEKKATYSKPKQKFNYGD